MDLKTKQRLIAIPMGIIMVTISLGLGHMMMARAAEIHQPGEWSDWWNIEAEGGSIDMTYATQIRRIYDQENKLVCWVARSSKFRDAGISIDCSPSLELGHPMAE